MTDPQQTAPVQGHVTSGIADPDLTRQAVAGPDAAARVGIERAVGPGAFVFGVATLVGYLALFLGHRDNGDPRPWAVIVLAVALVAAAVMTAMQVSGHLAGIQSGLATFGRVWGWATLLSVLGAVALYLAATDTAGFDSDRFWLHAPLVLLALVLAVGALRARDDVLGGLAAVIAVAVLASSFLPRPWVQVALALLAGGGLLAGAVLRMRATRRASRRVH